LPFEEDTIFEVMERATMNRVSITQDADEPRAPMLVLRSSDWKKSTQVTRAVLRAQRMQLPTSS
jgi:hypothetical protein